ncbi:MAG: M28 family metallopeptidase [Myxococcota bacterium]
MLFLLVACGAPSHDVKTPAGGDDTGEPHVPADPFALAEEVSGDNLAASIESLESFGTRYTGTESAREVPGWLAGELEGAGLVAETLAFDARGMDSANVIARKDGVEEPEVVYVFSAHWDSTSEDPTTSAPGADDNASGVAAVLEAARVLAPVRTRYSVWFVLTGAEEQGARGARELVDPWAGEDIRGVVAPDMIGYWPLGDGDAFDILGDEESEALATDMADVADRMGVANKVWIDHGYCYGDDHTYFQEAGFPAITPMDCVEAHNGVGDDEDTPHYHRTSDTSETLHIGFTTKVTKVVVATLAGWVI